MDEKNRGPTRQDIQGNESWDTYVQKILQRLQKLYQEHVKPLEQAYQYEMFKPSWFEESIMNAKPFITLFGPWSAGKSTFINHLLQSNHMWTGPQPTTAQFTVVMAGDEATPIGGRVLSAAKDLPFRGLTEFGDSFLECLSGYAVPHELLKSVSLIDTPGVLESAKDVHQRKYDYIKVCRWFVERSDLVIVMFDPTKMDAGVELRMLFKFAFKGNEGKVRILLNKADSVETQELMRVYGALYWNLSNMVNSTEPPRVYVGSFWDQPYRPDTFHELFAEEKADLLHEITEVVPLQALDKKITSLLKRARDVLVHALLIGVMREGLPMMFGKDKAKKKALEDLPMTYERVGQRFKMNHRDFPPVEDYREFLSKFDLENFPKLEKVEKEGLIAKIMNLTDSILPQLIRPLKTTQGISDPRDRQRAQELQAAYQQTIVNQMTGKGGIQGGEEKVSYRASPLDLLAAQQAAAQGPSSAPPPPPPPAPSSPKAAMDPQAMMLQFMAMQKAEQDRKAAEEAAAKAAQQKQAAALPGMPPGMTPEMMQQMFAMMQAQQAKEAAEKAEKERKEAEERAAREAAEKAEKERKETEERAEREKAAAAAAAPPAVDPMQAMMQQMMSNPAMMAQMMAMMQAQQQPPPPPPPSS